MRPSKTDYYLELAKVTSKRSPCLRKQYGAVLVKNDQVLATGYNGPVRGEPNCTKCTKVSCDKDMLEYSSCPACHAEMNCIISVSRDEMLGATLYLAGYITSTGEENLNVEPCEICLRLIKNAGIDRVVTNNGVLYIRDSNGILRKA